jgi:hypothetical protein
MGAVEFKHGFASDGGDVVVFVRSGFEDLEQRSFFQDWFLVWSRSAAWAR